MRMKTVRLAVLAGLGFTLPVAHGTQDIDLFLSTTSVTARPNILFVLDNKASWESESGTIRGMTQKEMEHRALYEVLTSCDLLQEPVMENGTCTDGKALINVGFMVFSNKQSDGKGGKVISALQPLDKAHQNRLAEMLYEGGDPNGAMKLPKSNNAPYAMTLNEVYRYYKGLEPNSGLQDGDHDPAAIAADGVKYESPAGGCSKNYAVLVANGEPDSGENNDAEATLGLLGGIDKDDPLELTDRFFESNWSDEFARFMSATDVNDDRAGNQGIATYVIDVHDHTDPTATDHVDDPGYGNKKFDGARDWLGNIGDRGQGGYFSASDVDDIRKAMEDIINKLVAKNTMFASTTLPVSVNVRGTHLNQVYMGVFRPDEDGRTRWHGNLKMYQLALTGKDNLFLADVEGRPVEDSESGFILNTAQSFWTKDSNYWSFQPSGVPESASDNPDGFVVEKGAVAQHLREDYPSRTLYTCTSCSSALQEFNSTNVNAAALGVPDAELETLIAWVKGEDNAMDATNRTEDGDSDTTDVRPWIHGDVLHARPAVVNYNRYANVDGTVNDDDIVAFYGANDGVFHAVKGGKGPTPPTGTNVEAGTELWGFIPPEFLDRLNALRENTLKGTANKQFFMDGPIGVYQQDVNGDGRLIAGDGDKVYLYVSMRRGGRLLYALDVSDPADPKLLWKKNQASSGYSELGQTWSIPQVVTIKQITNNATTLRPVLVFGGGYDAAAEDAFPQGTIGMGRGIFVVDAENGDVLWQAGPNPSGATVNKTVADMTYGIPSDVTVLDIDGDRSADRLYVGDTGGNIWRVDMNDPDPNNWVVRQFASLRGVDETAAVEDLPGNSHRKFLYAPDVVWNRDENYLGILIGSGDREKPGGIKELTVKNRFYMLKDFHVSAAIQSDAAFPGTLTEADLYDATDNLIQDGTDAERAEAQTQLSTKSGWYIRLLMGEKVVSNPVSLDGTTVFNTHRPDPDPAKCEQLGLAYVYQVNYENAAAVFNNRPGELNKADRTSDVAGGGYPPPPVHIIVQLDGKIREGISTGPNVKDGSDIEYGARRRTYWYTDID